MNAKYLLIAVTFSCSIAGAAAPFTCKVYSRKEFASAPQKLLASFKVDPQSDDVIVKQVTQDKFVTCSGANGFDGGRLLSCNLSNTDSANPNSSGVATSIDTPWFDFDIPVGDSFYVPQGSDVSYEVDCTRDQAAAPPQTAGNSFACSVFRSEHPESPLVAFIFDPEVDPGGNLCFEIVPGQMYLFAGDSPDKLGPSPRDMNLLLQKGKSCEDASSGGLDPSRFSPPQIQIQMSAPNLTMTFPNLDGLGPYTMGCTNTKAKLATGSPGAAPSSTCPEGTYLAPDARCHFKLSAASSVCPDGYYKVREDYCCPVGSYLNPDGVCWYPAAAGGEESSCWHYYGRPPTPIPGCWSTGDGWWFCPHSC